MLAWLYWNPSREILSLPLPLRWYGVLFALGFFLGYRLIFKMIRWTLLLKPEFQECDVNWPLFEKRAKDSTSELYRLTGGYFGREKSLRRLNELLMDIEKEPTLKWFGFIKKRIQGHKLRKIRSRLYLESAFPECFLQTEERTVELTESIVAYVVFGTLLGARLGHILFYENVWEYVTHPWRILMVWEGGLASHGAMVGILLMILILVKRFGKKVGGVSFLWFTDLLVIPALLAGTFIRIGNFFNQEILGTPSQLPWAIIFGQPADGGAIVPRHPAQLYEALFYALLFLVLLRFWSRRFGKCQTGLLTALGFTLVFSFRFLVEFVKMPQSKSLDGTSALLMGQWLSIPMMLAGLYLLLRILRAKGEKGQLLSD